MGSRCSSVTRATPVGPDRARRGSSTSDAVAVAARRSRGRGRRRVDMLRSIATGRATSRRVPRRRSSAGRSRTNRGSSSREPTLRSARASPLEPIDPRATVPLVRTSLEPARPCRRARRWRVVDGRSRASVPAVQRSARARGGDPSRSRARLELEVVVMGRARRAVHRLARGHWPSYVMRGPGPVPSRECLRCPRRW